MPHRIRVRAAEVADVEAIHALLEPFAAAGVILPRSRDDIFEHLQEFLVASYDGEPVGAAAMHIYGSNLAEVRSLVVREDMRGRGIGGLLLDACERWAAALGVARIFALTYLPEFFARFGYARVPKESLPHKVWTVCVHCPRFSNCDEIAVEKRLSDAPIEPMKLAPILEVEQP